MDLSFVHPGLAMAAAGLVSLPILIHILSRRRYRREPFAAMDFVFAAYQRTRRRMRLEGWMLLSLRCLVVLLAGMTIARPYSGSAVGREWLGRPRCDRVIIIDDSLSMQARLADGSSAFDLAKLRAIRLIDEASPQDGLAVLTASTQGRTWMQQPVRDHQAVREIVESLDCSTGMNDLSRAIEQASAVLLRGSAPQGGRLAFLVTDLTQSALASAASADAGRFSGIDQLVVVNVGPEDRRNLAIRSLACRTQVVASGIPVRFEVQVMNHGDETVEDAGVDISVDGRTVRSLPLGSLSAGLLKSREFELVLDGDGWHRLEARLAPSQPEILVADDVRRLSVRVSGETPILLVDGQYGGHPTDAHLFYYGTAIGGGQADTGRQLFRPTAIRPEALAEEPIHRYAAIVLGNVPRLPETMWNRLAEFVRAGGGLIQFIAESAVAANYNGFAAGGLLPVRLGQWDSSGDDSHGLHFRLHDRSHETLADLRGHDRGGLLLAKVLGRWRAEPDTLSPTARTLLAFSDSQPAVIADALGRGRIVTVLTGVDMRSANLPAKPDFLPLMLNLTAFVAAPATASSEITCGGLISCSIPLTSGANSAELIRPDGGIVRVTPNDADGCGEIRYRDTAAPGYYAVRIKDRAIEFAVNVETADSDLREPAPGAIARLMPGKSSLLEDTDSVFAVQALRPRAEAAALCGVLLLIVVGLESTFAAWCGRAR